MLLPIAFIPIMKNMIPDRLLLAKCVLGKAALLPLLYKIKHLLSYFGLTAHIILISLQIYRPFYSRPIGTWTVGYTTKAYVGRTKPHVGTTKPFVRTTKANPAGIYLI